MAQDARQRAETAKTELDLITDKALTERKEKFQEQEQTFTDTIFTKQAELEAVVLELSSVTQNHTNIRNELQLFHNRKIELQNELKALEVQKLQAQKILIEARRTKKEISDLHHSILELTSQAETLQLQNTTINNENEHLEDKKKAFEHDLVNVTEAIENQLTDKEKKIAELDSHLLNKRLEIDKLEIENDKTRDSFARRETELEDRDRNLRLREMKVVQDEQKIQSNSELLNL